MNKESKVGLFDHVDEVRKRQRKDYWDTLGERDVKTWSTFMVNRFLSMNPELIPIINELQPFTTDMEDEHVYRLYIELFPKDDSYYKYISKKARGRRYEQWMLDMVKEYYEVSYAEADKYIDTYIEIGDASDLLTIAESYAYDEKRMKQIKKLIK